MLNEEEQYNAIWNTGTFVDSYFYDNIRINLYVINEFYVEVYYNNDSNKILYKKTFKEGELLDKYLKIIKLAL